VPRDRQRRAFRHDAPVDYGPIRAGFQRVRAGLAVAILGVAAGGIALGVPGASLKAAAFAVVVADALVRSRRDGRPLGSLSVDGFVAGFAAGAGSMIEAPLVAFGAYALAASLSFGGLRTLGAVVAMTSAGAAVRLAITGLADPGPTPGAAALLHWFETGVYLLALGLTLTAAGRRPPSPPNVAPRR